MRSFLAVPEGQKVNTAPKTIKQLLTALSNAVYNTQSSCYDPDYYELKEG